MFAKRLLTVLGALAVGTAMAGVARAGSMTGPALLFISSSSSSYCGSGNACVVNGEANPLTSSTLYVDFNSNGSSHSVVNPVLLIVGIPGMTTTAPTISQTISFNGTATGGSAALSGTDVYGGTWGSSGLGTFNSTESDAYAALGLNGNSSENFGNWQSATDTTLGSMPSMYTLAVYDLNPYMTFGAGDNLDVSLTGLAAGDIVIGYGCAESTTMNAQCPNGDVYSTPFTQAGAFTTVPEPSTLALFAVGLAGLGFALRRRLRKAA